MMMVPAVARPSIPSLGRIFRPPVAWSGPDSSPHTLNLYHSLNSGLVKPKISTTIPSSNVPSPLQGRPLHGCGDVFAGA
ncbi:MAG: hypothetical protein DMG16_26345 [Acidobacteria bacterium]|nr:MAG: hypothetical protein DMG16_26345 [Acidobacteriota bacterium]